jgi:hypothetical protein
MADNLDSPFTGNFGIEDTMEMGAGDTQLLKDLMGPETSTGDPDDIQLIEEKETKKEEVKKQEAAPEKKVEETGQNLISNFLSDGEEEPIDDEEEPIKKEKTVAQEEEKVDDDQSSPFDALARDLLKLGVFTQDDDDEEISIKTPQEFLDKFNNEKRKGAIEIVNNFIGQFGEDYQQAFDAIFVKGVSPKEYFAAYNEVADFATLDMKNEGNQELVIRKALADQGFEEEDINSEIERLKNYGDLETVANKHHKVVVKKQATKLQQMETQAEQEMQQKALIKNQYVQNVNTILQEKLKSKEFDGIPLNPKLAAELQDFLLVDKYKTKSGETLTDFDRTILEMKRPENHAMKVKVALILKILEKDPTLSTIQKTGVTKKSNELFGEIARQQSKVKTPQGKQQYNSWFI